ncbi:MAG: DUF5698 domain-containing protein [Chloroflexi bacterium]|nr:DUF5698 domain-containing protein [Chloroflexota bacterium]
MNMFQIPPLDLQIFAGMLLIFCLRILDVSMGTIRTIMVVRGLRKWAVLIGFVEVTIWVVAISQVISNLNNLWNVLAYSGGFAAGTFVGMHLENRLALGNVQYRCCFPEERGGDCRESAPGGLWRHQTNG